MSASSETEIANMALDLLKEAPINSFNDDRASARWMNRNYALYRDVVLAAHLWKFASSRAELAALEEGPTYGWQYRYKKPDDCLRVIPLRHLGSLNGYLIPHEVEGEYILTDAPPPIKIRYLRRVTNVSEYNNSPLFILALSTRLAGALAAWLTGREGLVQMANEEHEKALTMARHIDSSEGTAAEQYANAFDEPRFTGYGYGRHDKGVY